MTIDGNAVAKQLHTSSSFIKTTYSRSRADIPVVREKPSQLAQ